MAQLLGFLSLVGSMLAAAAQAAVEQIDLTDHSSDCAIEIRRHPDSPLLKQESSLKVGNKGEEQLDVSPTGDCEQARWLFDHAEIEIYSQRFGNAQFTSLPTKGCAICEPISVRWYHEPTGHLSFGVTVYQRKLPKNCSDPIQSKETLQ